MPPKLLNKTFFYKKTNVFIILIIISTVTSLFFGCKISNDPNTNFSWKKIESLPLNPQIEKQIDEIITKLTLEQKVGQVIQGDSDSCSVEYFT